MAKFDVDSDVALLSLESKDYDTFVFPSRRRLRGMDDPRADGRVRSRRSARSGGDDARCVTDVVVM